MGQPGLFLIYFVFSSKLRNHKIQTWIVGVEGEDADH